MQIAKLPGEDIVLLQRQVQAGTCQQADSLPAIKPDGSAAETEYFNEYGALMDAADFKIEGGRLTCVENSVSLPMT
ncbi:MAG: hypothetical protein ACU837_14135 [Gammaproteobacteria bacterium]